MTTALERDLKAYVIRALHAAEGNPLLDDELKASVRNAFPRVAFTAQQLTALLEGLKADALTQSDTDAVLGLKWSLTLKGQTTAQRLA